MQKFVTLSPLSYDIGLLPGDVRSLIFEYDDTYRQKLVQEVFPENLSHVWKRRAKQWLMEYPYTNDAVPEGLHGEYVLFTYRRNRFYIHVLIAFVHVYYQGRIRCVPPDDLNMYLYQYDDTLTILENEGHCGRFHLDWEISPSYPVLEIMDGFVVHRSEFEKGYVLIGTDQHPNFTLSPLEVHANGTCTDPRVFHWHGSDDFVYSILFVQDDVYVVLEQE